MCVQMCTYIGGWWTKQVRTLLVQGMKFCRHSKMNQSDNRHFVLRHEISSFSTSDGSYQVLQHAYIPSCAYIARQVVRVVCTYHVHRQVGGENNPEVMRTYFMDGPKANSELCHLSDVCITLMICLVVHGLLMQFGINGLPLALPIVSSIQNCSNPY